MNPITLAHLTEQAENTALPKHERDAFWLAVTAKGQGSDAAASAIVRAIEESREQHQRMVEAGTLSQGNQTRRFEAAIRRAIEDARTVGVVTKELAALLIKDMEEGPFWRAAARQATMQAVGHAKQIADAVLAGATQAEIEAAAKLGEGRASK